MKRLWLLSMIFSLSFVQAQDSTRVKWGLQWAYHPYDFFGGVQYAREQKRITHTFLLSMGVNRTFFQRRMYPQFAYQFGYDLIKSEMWKAGPAVRPVFTASRINKEVAHGTAFTEELFPVVCAGYGAQNSIVVSTGFGPTWEQSWSSLEHRYRNWFSWNYFVEFTFSHAF